MSAKGELDGAGCRDKSIRRSPEQMKILQLRAKNARLRMERDIAKKPRRTSRRTRCEVRLESPDEKTVPGDAEHHGDTSGFRDDVTLAAQLAPIRRVGAGVRPTRGLRTLAPTMLNRMKSSFSTCAVHRAASVR